MALVTMKFQLVQLKDSMYSEGLLDEQFYQIEILQRADNPNLIVEAINTFLDGTQSFLNQAEQLLVEKSLDFSSLIATVHHLKGSCLMFGARKLNLAAIPLVQFCKAANMNGFIQALDMFKAEYLHMRNKLETILQLENQIQAAEAEGRGME